MVPTITSMVPLAKISEYFTCLLYIRVQTKGVMPAQTSPGLTKSVQDIGEPGQSDRLLEQVIHA